MNKKQALANYLETDVNNIVETNGLYKTNSIGSRTYRVLTETEADTYARDMVTAYTGDTDTNKITWRIQADGRETYTSIDRREHKQDGYVICLENL